MNKCENCKTLEKKIDQLSGRFGWVGYEQLEKKIAELEATIHLHDLPHDAGTIKVLHDRIKALEDKLEEAEKSCNDSNHLTTVFCQACDAEKKESLRLQKYWGDRCEKQSEKIAELEQKLTSAVAEEREKCAGIAENISISSKYEVNKIQAKSIANAIRQRGK